MLLFCAGLEAPCAASKGSVELFDALQSCWKWSICLFVPLPGDAEVMPGPRGVQWLHLIPHHGSAGEKGPVLNPGLKRGVNISLIASSITLN